MARCVKQHFAPREIAAQTANMVLRKKGVRRIAKFNVYWCKRCKCWHWGNRRPYKSG